MMRAARLAAAALLLGAAPVLAKAPPVPPARATAAAAAAPDAAVLAPLPAPAPRAAVRPQRLMTALKAPVAPPRPVRGAERVGADVTLLAAAMPVPQRTGADALCGDARLRGARMPRIGSSSGCGIDRPVRLASAAGVRLDPPATVDCSTAVALADWLDRAVKPAAKQYRGTSLVALDVAASYACRRVNNRPGGPLSEHARGLAIDIDGFLLADGRRVALPGGWHDDARGFMQAAWRGACGPFGTVLGPEADPHHRDHFHFDVKQRRHGLVCR